jgi:two-component system KDP operon response regulator KdpE
MEAVMKQTILLINWHPKLSRLLESALCKHLFKITALTYSSNFIGTLAQYQPSMTLLDTENIPSSSTLVSKAKALFDTPIITLVNHDDEETAIEHLNAGADDYIVKPFNMRLLIAKLQATLKRSCRQEEIAETLTLGDITIDLIKHQVTINQAIVDLSPKEFALLTYLVRNKGKLLSHQQILQNVWGKGYTEHHQYLRVYIGHLRKKILPMTNIGLSIHTASGLGYRID